MISRLVLSDVDSTVLDIPAFIEALPIAAIEAFPEISITPEEFRSQLKPHYNAAGWDIMGHFADLGIDLTDRAKWRKLVEATTAVHKRLTSRNSFLYPEVATAFKRLRATPGTTVALMSRNPDENFQFKLDLCEDELSDIPYRVVQRNKGTVINKDWAESIVFLGVVYDEATVVDDDPSQIEAVNPRPNIRRVQVVRPGQRYPGSTNPAIRKITSFDELR